MEQATCRTAQTYYWEGTGHSPVSSLILLRDMVEFELSLIWQASLSGRVFLRV